VGIQRQMPAIEIDIICQQRLQALAFNAANHRRFAFPEITMMNYHRIRLQAHGLIQQRLAGGDAGDNFLHRLTPFHLKAIWRVVAECRAIELFVNQLFQFAIFHCRSIRSSFCAQA
jgi:hypothetical protein